MLVLGGGTTHLGVGDSEKLLFVCVSSVVPGLFASLDVGEFLLTHL